MKDIKLKLDCFSNEDLLTLGSLLNRILDIPENQATLNTINSFEVLEEIYKASNIDKKLEEDTKLLQELNDFWANEYISVHRKSPNGLPETRYFRISRIDKAPYGLDNDLVAYTTFPSICVIEGTDGKPHYEIRYLEVIDNTSKEAIIPDFDTEKIKGMMAQDYCEAESTYRNIYTAAVDYFVDLDVKEPDKSE